MWALAWMLVASAATATQPPDARAPGTLLFVGQVSRLDLVEGSVWLRLDGRAVDQPVRVDPERTLLTRAGRPVRPEEVEPGQRASAVCEAGAAAEPPRALVVRLAPSRPAPR
jgi:hypothetical protein